MSNYFNMFTVPYQRVNVSSVDFDRLEKFCLDKREEDRGRDKSNWGGYQSHDLQMVDYPAEFQFFVSDLLDETRKFASEIDLDEKLGLGNSWININSFKDSNRHHVHPGCILSGIYYVKTPPKSGKLIFSHPIEKLLACYWSKHRIKSFNEVTSAEWGFYPEKGDFFIFPSWLEHHVQPHRNEDEERISIAFNFYY